MKKILIYLFIPIFLVFSSCSDFVEDINVSPNSPEEAPLPLVLSALEVATFSHYTGNLARTAGILTQQLTGAQFQAAQTNLYDINEQSFGNEFESLYTGGMANAKIIIENATSPEQYSPYYAGIARVLLAMNLALATDLFGDIPYSEAFQGTGNENPKFDSQEFIYQQIQAELDQAIIDFQQPAEDNIFIPELDDFIHNGDVQAWTTTAWILKARYANRLSQRPGSVSDTQILEWLENAYANPVDAYAHFGGTGQDQNQWYAFGRQRGGYIYLSENLVETMKSLNDPRLPVYASLDPNEEYSGTPITGTGEASYVGETYASADASLPLVTIYEAKFIEAEAALRAGLTEQAQTAYREAIALSLEFNGVSDEEAADYLLNVGTLEAGNELEQIINQKYLAMFTQIEPYNDFRRTGYPNLTPNPDGFVNTIPVRFPLAQSERLYNSSSEDQLKEKTDPVWWDN